MQSASRVRDAGSVDLHHQLSVLLIYDTHSLFKVKRELKRISFANMCSHGGVSGGWRKLSRANVLWHEDWSIPVNLRAHLHNIINVLK